MTAAHPAGIAEEPKSRVFGLLLAGFTVVAVVLWLPPLGSSLWLDETGTVWTIADGLGPAFGRSLDFQGQSPLYYAIAWLARELFGDSEIALRAPSLLALVGAGYVVGRIGKRLFGDAEAGWLAALAFACTSAVAFAAADARPYAFALLTSALATLTLIRWLDNDRATDLALYVVTAALTIYAHYLTAVVFGAHLVYALARARGAKPEPPPRKLLLLAPLFVAVACLPLIPQFAALLGRRESLSSAIVLRFSRLAVIVAVPLAMVAGGAVVRALRGRRSFALQATTGSVLVVLLVFAITDVSALESLSTPVVAALAAAVLIAGALLARSLRLRARDLTTPLREQRATLALLLAWALLPPLAMYVLTATGVARVFVPRYYVSAAPGVALLAAWMIRQLDGERLRVLLAAGMLAGAALSFKTEHFTEDWRGAMKATSAAVASDQEPVLVRTDFIEARSVEALRRQPEWLLAPLAAYPVRGRAYPLPYGVSDAEARFVLGLEADALQDVDAFVVVTNRIHTYQGLLKQRFEARGFRTRSLGDFGSIRVVRFERGG